MNSQNMVIKLDINMIITVKIKTNNQWNTFQPYTYKLFTKLNSAKFLKDLKKLFKEKEIFSDHGLHGGGLNMKNSTGKLNPHLDNSYHPKTDC